MWSTRGLGGGWALMGSHVTSVMKSSEKAPCTNEL